jgi:hypothetical protein
MIEVEMDGIALLERHVLSGRSRTRTWDLFLIREAL